MQVWRELSDVPADFGPSVVTIGNFDGVHRGHASVLRRMCADAAGAGAQAVAVTFSPHPQQVHRPDTAPPLLTGDADRLELLEATGLDAVLLLEYTLDFARQTPAEFVQRYLVDVLHARTVVVGRDVRFGWNNSGDLSTMVELGRQHGFDVEVIDDVTPAASADPGSAEDRAADPLRRRWSSTWVRELLDAGDVVQAARVLGRPHRVRGTVVHGDARGREPRLPDRQPRTRRDRHGPRRRRLRRLAAPHDRRCRRPGSRAARRHLHRHQPHVRRRRAPRRGLRARPHRPRPLRAGRGPRAGERMRPTLRFDSIDA